MLGLAVILMVFLTAGFCAAELLRGFRLWKMALVLHRADVTGRALAAEKLMFAMIRLLGVDAGRTLGPVTRLRIRYLIFGEAFHGRKGQLQDRKK